MSQHKTILKLLLSIFSLTLFLSLTGCATLAVNQFIHHPSTDIMDELAPTNKDLSGVYSGIEVINNHNYARIIVTPACKEMPIINLLLPTEKNFDNKAILRLGDSKKEQLPHEDKYIGQSVKIFSYKVSNDKKTDIDKDMMPIQSTLDWHGYPSTIIVQFEESDLWKEKKAQETISYKIGSKANDVLDRSLYWDCKNGPCGDWQCKNKENNFAGIILKIFTVPLDIITLPVQMLVVVLILSFGKGGP
jgi:hypothetical protein